MNAFLETRKFILLGILAAIALLGVLIVGNMKGEWVCEDGMWIKKGRVNSDPPLVQCLRDEFK